MSIVLFQEITTEEALSNLEEEGKKYEGLYVDMNDKEQRKYVKDNAQLINDLIKKLDRSRIDKSKAYKMSVESEAKAIRERLEAANLPFTMLIDAHKHERSEILAAEKAKTEAMALALQIEADHESAIMMDKIQTIEAKEREQQRIADQQLIASEAAERAVQEEKRLQANKAKHEEFKRLQREADTANVSSVRKAAKESLMATGLDEAAAKRVVMAIHSGSIANVSISY